MDWDAIRREFPALSGWTYLNTATFGQPPALRHRGRLRAIGRIAMKRPAAIFLDWFDDADRLRGSLARLIGAGADDIAFVPSAAHTLSLVANGHKACEAPTIRWLRSRATSRISSIYPTCGKFRGSNSTARSTRTRD